MLKCQGGCQQMYEEYYRMPDGKIFCEKCWRHGREMADMAAIQRHNQILQVQRDKDIFEQRTKEDRIRLSQLEHAIQLEKDKCRSAWSDYESDLSDKPYNYAEVELLRRQHDDLERQLNSRAFKYPEGGPTPSNSYYFSKAQFISKSQAHYFETVTLPQEKAAARKAEQEKIKVEQERQRKIELEKKRQEEIVAKKKAELKPLEDAILKREKLPINSRVKVAKETYREDVMMRCLRDSAKTVWKSLRLNPNMTEKIRIELEKKERADSISNASTVANYSQPSTPQKEEEIGCLQTIFNWLFFLGLLAAIIFAIASIFG